MSDFAFTMTLAPVAWAAIGSALFTMLLGHAHLLNQRLRRLQTRWQVAPAVQTPVVDPAQLVFALRMGWARLLHR
jgi:hypothetical protein